ncbi:MAG: FliH/SctL family protein [Verrucomicrobiota bacterium]
MSLSVDVVLPHEVKAVKILSDEEAKVWEEEYDVGFSEGYQAGQWRATRELYLLAKQHAIEINGLLATITKIHDGLAHLAEEHLPELLRTALMRVFSNYQLTDEQVAVEIENLIKQLKQGDHVKIQMSPAQLERVRAALDRYEVTLPDLAMSWEPSTSLQEGEFMLTSELGQFDGRTSKRITKIQEALEPYVNP